MAEATLGRVGLRGLVPRGLGPRPAIALERALGEPFSDALGPAFDPLAEVDPGALWVLRRLDVRVAVPAGEPDAATQARRVAGGVARAVRRVVADGPGPDAVRFTSRAEFVAAYVRARLARRGDSWVFERFGSLAALPVVDAVAAASKVADVDLLDAVAELARGGGWTRLVTSVTPAEGERLAASLERRAAGVGAPADVLALVARVRAERAAGYSEGSVPVLTGARARLELVGELAADQAVDAALIAAIWRLVPASSAPTTEALSPASPARSGLSEPQPGGHDSPTPTALDAAASGPQIFASAGAAALLLLADLAELLSDAPELTEPTPAAAAVRAAVLAGALGTDADDPAVRLAAGLTKAPEPDAWASCLDGPLDAWVEALAADPVLGWQHPDDPAHVATTTARDGRLGTAAIALLRRFARHLPGFGRSAAAHLVPQVLPPGGTVRVTDDLIEAVLPAGPLHVLLALASLDAVACRVPWLPQRVVVTHEAPS